MAFETLLQAPKQIVDSAGVPVWGTFSGSPDETNWQDLKGPRLRWPAATLRRKRWLYAALSTPELLLTTAVVDVGYVCNAFVFAVDLRAGVTLFQKSWLGVPNLMARVSQHPGAGAKATFRGPRVRIRIERRGEDDPYGVQVQCGGDVEVTASIAGPAGLTAGGAQAMTYVGAVDGAGGRGNCTQKIAASRAEGVVRIGGRQFSLSGGHGGLDYTDGILARETQWRWAFAQGVARGGRVVGVNLVEGFNARAPGAAGEDALWLDGLPRALAPARFEFDAEKWQRPWRVRTEDGALDLEAVPVTGYCERHELGLARSRFLQVAARFRGVVHTPEGDVWFDDVPGVTEDQAVKW